ncbi:ly6/PLAUR domain-containing protein 6 [Malurus melanocephalus]|uniref:ly6/PLAUR domain-containing protein 6 n=1 Tax=Malurus melanocephalus TaxID=175006 RepID=UPI002547D18E|nr:ly6/PLAUR domain-containing protein 6 [Malurus melanocephalus]
MAWPPGLLLSLSLSLLLLLLAGHAPATRSRDFSAKDIVYLHPSTTPYPHGFKCFTCEKASDNYECNRWAPDVYCPRGTRYCFSQHMMKASGESVSVTKRCVALEECLSTGCTYIRHEEYKVCTSCCEGSICNLPLPRNATDAVFSTLSPLNGGTPPLSPPGLGTPLGLCLGLLAQRWLAATATGTATATAAVPPWDG